jgi:anaerobic selenocysteine-containing dehydrogenase
MDDGRSLDDVVRAASGVTLAPSLERLADAIGDARLREWLRAMQADPTVCLRCATRGSTVFVRWDGRLVEIERRGETYTSRERVVDEARAQAIVRSAPAVGLVFVTESPFGRV